MKAFRQKNGNNDIYLNETATVVRQGIEIPVMEIAMATDKNAYAYIIGDAIRTVKGELQLDTENGIPYFATVFDRSDKLNIWRHYVEKKILGFDFVTGISQFNAEIIGDDRMLKYDMIVETSTVRSASPLLILLEPAAVEAVVWVDSSKTESSICRYSCAMAFRFIVS